VGWCSEFGVEITACDHPMIARADACACEVCGARCEGRFDGCPAVWAKGPVQVELVRRQRGKVTSNGSRPGDATRLSSNDGITEVRESLQRLEARLNMLEMNVTRLLDPLVAHEVSSNGSPGRTGD